MTSKLTTPTNRSPEQIAQAEKFAKDLTGIATFVFQFLLVTAAIWAAYDLAAPFWHLPLANYFEALGTLGLLFVLRLLIEEIKSIFR